MITYGRELDWTTRAGARTTLKVSECASPEEATSALLRMAQAMGWTPPRWWQFWRWRDTRLPVVSP